MLSSELGTFLNLCPPVYPGQFASVGRPGLPVKARAHSLDSGMEEVAAVTRQSVPSEGCEWLPRALCLL